MNSLTGGDQSRLVFLFINMNIQDHKLDEKEFEPIDPFEQPNYTPTSNASRLLSLVAIFNSIPEAVIATERTGVINFINPKAAEYLSGKSLKVSPVEWPAEFGFYLDDGQTLFPDRRMPLIRALNGETVDAEEMIMLLGGKLDKVWISMSAQPFLDEAGEILGAVVTFRDISYRKQIELSREKHTRRVEALHALSQSISELGSDLPQILNSVAINTANYIGDACVVTQYLSKEHSLQVAAGYHTDIDARALLKMILIEEEYDLSRGIIAGVVESGEPLLVPSINVQQAQAITLPAYAKYIEVVGISSLLVVPIKGRSGILGTIGVTRDRGKRPYTIEDQALLTDIAMHTALAIEHCMLVDSLRMEIMERHTVERALNESEVRFRSIFESTTLGIKVLDLDGNISQINPAFPRMIGYSPEQLVGSHFSRFIHPADAERSINLFENLKQGALPGFRLEHRLIHKSGEVVWVNATFTGVMERPKSDQLSFVVSIAENITDQKKIELEVLGMKNRLQYNVERERLRLAQELHDGPMQDLYSAIFQMDGLPGSNLDDHKENIKSVKEDLQKVIQDLRSITMELRPPTIATFGLEKAIESHCLEFQSKHPEIEVELLLARDLKLIPENIRIALYRIYQQAMANIVRHAQASKVKVEFTFDDTVARLDITDNGKGFIVPKNWIGFTRQGHFGLAGAAERIETLGGTFEVNSHPGDGTNIHVIVPYKESNNGHSPSLVEGVISV